MAELPRQPDPCYACDHGQQQIPGAEIDQEADREAKCAEVNLGAGILAEILAKPPAREILLM